jgi:hypothetical protein
MNIPDPWAGVTASPGAAGQTIDVTAEVIGKRRSARDAAKNFLKNKARQAQQSVVGKKIPSGAPALAAIQGAGAAIGYTLGRQQGYQNPTAPGILPTAAATFLGGPFAGIGYATGRYQGRKNAQRDEAAAVNPAAQMPLY